MNHPQLWLLRNLSRAYDGDSEDKLSSSIKNQFPYTAHLIHGHIGQSANCWIFTILIHPDTTKIFTKREAKQKVNFVVDVDCDLTKTNFETSAMTKRGNFVFFSCGVERRENRKFNFNENDKMMDLTFLKINLSHSTFSPPSMFNVRFANLMICGSRFIK